MKHMGQILALVLALVLLTGCGGTAPETTAPAETTAPVETTTPVETTVPPETTAPTEPAVTEPAETKVELTEQGRYEINIFLSNFSEQQFWGMESGVFRSADGDPAAILFFTWNNLNYNTYDAETIQRDGVYYLGFPMETVSARAERFFGRGLSAADVEAAGGDFRMIDGLVCRPEAWGDTYEDMTVADAMYDLGNGTMRVEFTVYNPTDDAWMDEVTSAGGINVKSIYYFTPEQAVESGYFVPHIKGTALVRPKTLTNGRETYELVTYELFESE